MYKHLIKNAYNMRQLLDEIRPSNSRALRTQYFKMTALGTVGIALFDFLALLFSFLSLCIVCDEHLVPAVEVFIVQFQVPEEVAGKIPTTMKCSDM